MKIKSLFIVLVVAAGLSSCKKDDFNYPDGTVGISKIVYFPSVSIKGDHLIILTQGQTFTDPGATAILNGAAVQYTTTGGTVNTSAGGLYNLVYTATNAEGYSASDWRTVVVIGNDVAANDFSGTYLRTGFTTSTWTKTASGIYDVENPGGAGAGAGLHVIAVNYTGKKIAIPKQVSPDFGIVSSGSESYSSGPPATYTWIFFAGGYGTGARTFIKQ